jgi:hypothetical protein
VPYTWSHAIEFPIPTDVPPSKKQMRFILHIFTVLVVIFAQGVFAQTCEKITEQPRKIVFSDSVHGNWGPLNNTKNFSYQIRRGAKDVYLHKNGNRTVSTTCSVGQNLPDVGEYKTDFYADGQDACVKYQCPNGYLDTGTVCRKTEYAGVIDGIGPFCGISGDWKPWHNTKNFQYVVVKGGRDYYKKKSTGATVGMICNINKGCGSPGHYVIDASADGTDECKRSMNTCPSGFSIKY